MNNNLSFRRQFILGPKELTIDKWNKRIISEGMFLFAHPDLEITESSNAEISLVLLGYIIDCGNELNSNQEILDYICKNSSSFIEVIKNTGNCNGRWIIIYVDKEKNQISIFNDPIASRQLCYIKIEDNVWCASQPSLLSHYLDIKLDDDPLLYKLIQSDEFIKEEKFMPGDSTIYKDVKQLLPNHYLNFTTGKSIRYYPEKIIESVPMNCAVNMISNILKKSIMNISKRYDLMLAVTGGIDSRICLAASKDIKDDIFYFLLKFNHLNKDSLDIQIPTKLLANLKLNFNLIDLDKNASEEFEKNFFDNITGSREKFLYGAYTFYLNFGDKVRISGQASEIGRNFYYDYYDRKVSGKLLAELSGYKNDEFSIKHLNRWILDVNNSCKKYDMNIFDLFYWEQRIGRWAAIGASETEIANEEFILFNNRQLLNILLGVNKKFRIGPKYILYRKIIDNLWNETLAQPINSKNDLELYTKYFVKSFLKKMHLINLVKKYLKRKNNLK